MYNLYYTIPIFIMFFKISSTFRKSNYLNFNKLSGFQKFSFFSVTSDNSKSNCIKEHINNFNMHQSTAKYLSIVEEAKTLLENSLGYGVLSTNSFQHPGYPSGSVVGFSIDDEGYPFFAFSKLASHTKDITTNNKVSLSVTANDFKGASEGRVLIIGTINRINDNITDKYRSYYLERHKNAYWIDFNDFSFYKFDQIINIRFVGGFSKAGQINVNEFLKCKSDPIAPYSKSIMDHMNNDHKDSLILIVKKYIGIDVLNPNIIEIDKYGLTLSADINLGDIGHTNIRLPFIREVTDRKEVKEVIIEMLSDT